MGLTAKQRCFVAEYLKDLNATQAAIRAGYSKKSAGTLSQQLLAKKHVSEAIREAIEAREKRSEITSDRVLREYARLSFSNIVDAVSWDQFDYSVDKEGNPVVTGGLKIIPSEELSRDVTAAIQEISQTKDGTIKVKFHDKKGALENLAKHLGIQPDSDNPADKAAKLREALKTLNDATAVEGD